MHDQRRVQYGQLGLLVTILMLFSCTASAEIYRWVDAEGRTHYGDRPASGAELIELDVAVPSSAVDQHAMDTASSVDPAAELTASSLAKCLSRNGVKYYTASWCPQCAKQRKLFGRGASVLPAVECSVGGKRKQTRACERADIKAYPTWIFADGSRSAGVKSLANLARRSGCD